MVGESPAAVTPASVVGNFLVAPETVPPRTSPSVEFSSGWSDVAVGVAEATAPLVGTLVSLSREASKSSRLLLLPRAEALTGLRLQMVTAGKSIWVLKNGGKKKK